MIVDLDTMPLTNRCCIHLLLIKTVNLAIYHCKSWAGGVVATVATLQAMVMNINGRKPCVGDNSPLNLLHPPLKIYWPALQSAAGKDAEWIGWGRGKADGATGAGRGISVATVHTEIPPPFLASTQSQLSLQTYASKRAGVRRPIGAHVS